MMLSELKLLFGQSNETVGEVDWPIQKLPESPVLKESLSWKLYQHDKLNELNRRKNDHI